MFPLDTGIDNLNNTLVIAASAVTSIVTIASGIFLVVRWIKSYLRKEHVVLKAEVDNLKKHVNAKTQEIQNDIEHRFDNQNKLFNVKMDNIASSINENKNIINTALDKISDKIGEIEENRGAINSKIAVIDERTKIMRNWFNTSDKQQRDREE